MSASLRRRLALFLLLLTLALSFGVGCSSREGSRDSPPGSGGAPETAPAREESASPEDVAERSAPAEKEPASPEGEEKPSEPAPSKPPAKAASSFPVTVHFIDVGQGDSILILTAEKKAALVDGGPRSAGPTVVKYLKDRGVKEIDLLISTHPHEDHIGGLLAVLDAFPVKQVVDGAVPHTTKTFEDYLVKIKEKKIKYIAGRKGKEFSLGDVRISVLWPEEPPPEDDLNGCSVASLVTAGKTDVLLMGDLPGGYEKHVDGDVEVLKVAHHGSKGSTYSGFLEQVKPEDAVICVGENSYGHPSPETLERLARAGVRVYRTDAQGTVVVTIDKESYTVDKEPWEPGKKASVSPPVPAGGAADSGKFVGSKKSDKYHYPTCRYAKDIKPENLVEFESPAEAKAAGYVPCKVCKPPEG